MNWDCCACAENGKAAGGFQRLGEQRHDLLARSFHRRGGHLRQRPAVDRASVAVDQAALGQSLRDQRNPAGIVQVFRDVRAAGLEARDHRRSRSDPIEVVDAQGHAGLPGDGEQVQHPVRRAAGRGDRRDGVLERGLRDDLAGSDVLRHQLHHEPAGSLGDLVFV